MRNTKIYFKDGEAEKAISYYKKPEITELSVNFKNEGDTSIISNANVCLKFLTFLNCQEYIVFLKIS